MSQGTEQVVQAEVHLAFGTVITFSLYPLSKHSRKMSPVSLSRLENPESRSSKLTGSRVLLLPSPPCLSCGGSRGTDG